MAEALLKSAYEVARENRLKRNREIMDALGLVQTANTPTAIGGTPDGSASMDTKPKHKAQKLRELQEPTRRSKRVRGLSPEGQPVEVFNLEENDDDDDDDYDSHLMQAKIHRLKALHEARNTGYKNPTATYEHTWMRVRTMNDQALARRIKVIEKALGQYCVVKMRMFAEVLLLANKDDLAKEASDALDRLLALGLSEQPIVEQLTVAQPIDHN